MNRSTTNPELMLGRVSNALQCEIPKPRRVFESTRFPSPTGTTTQKRRTRFDDSSEKEINLTRRRANRRERSADRASHLLVEASDEEERPQRLHVRKGTSAKNTPSLIRPRLRVEGGRWPGPRVERDGGRCYRGPRSLIANLKSTALATVVWRVRGDHGRRGCYCLPLIRKARKHGSGGPKFFENL